MFTKLMRRWNKLSIGHRVFGLCAIGLVGIVAFWLLSPLFYNRTVNEGFPAANAMSQPTADAMVQPTAMAMPTADAMALPTADTMAQPTAMALPTADAMAQPTAMALPTADTIAMPTADAMAMPTADAKAEPQTLRSGMFVDGFPGHHAMGQATIYQLADGKRVLRLEDFTATNGPDLYISLHPGTNPLEDKGTFLPLAMLKGNQGAQNYELPADLDLSNYRSVVIWCRTFNVVFGYAALSQ